MIIIFDEFVITITPNIYIMIIKQIPQLKN